MCWGFSVSVAMVGAGAVAMAQAEVAAVTIHNELRQREGLTLG